jgi:hypothetical protein
MATKMIENSLTWATVRPQRNAVRLRYPMYPVMAMTISGLPIRTNNDSTTAGPTPPERQDDEEADDDGEGQLPETGGQRDRTDMANMLQVELETEDEQQHCHANLGEQVDLVMRRDDTEHGRRRGR